MAENQHTPHKFTAIEMVATPKAGKIVAYWIIGLLAILFACLFLPWQQNIHAYGQLTSYKPQDRPQTIQATIPGRIIKWYVQEGEFVKEGDTIVELAEVKDAYFDPQTLLRLKEQIAAKETNIKNNEDKVIALTAQIQAIGDARDFKLSQAKNKLAQALNKFSIDSADLVAARANNEIAKIQMERFEKLFEQGGLRSKVDLENRQIKFQETQAKLASADNKLLVARNDILNARIDLNGLVAEYQDKLQKATSDLNSAKAYVAEAQGELAKMKNYYANTAIRFEYYFIKAPQNGFVVRAQKQGIGEIIKETEPIITIMPSNPQLAVELYVKAMDIPLLRINDEVRVQFDGWPAIQFSGWPNLSVGTFGGRVAVIDYTESDKSTYRILVVPDAKQESWPDLLRVGSGARGWAMLNEVPIWYELWRQINGFPADLPIPIQKAKSKSTGEKSK